MYDNVNNGDYLIVMNIGTNTFHLIIAKKSEKNPLELPGSLSDIKALPASSGDLLIWTQEIFHWGSSSTDKHDESARTSSEQKL